ncbi:MAG: family 10 glycosylhydrolase [Candidatus Aminicenantes bacterium]|nr:family 10 glycosylhydrolase [Candidatus Aminicenantes bacterium]
MPGSRRVDIDSFSYPDAAAIRAAWRSGAGSPPPDVAASGPWGSQLLGAFRCDFSASGRERCYWDRDVSLDLGGYQCFALCLYCSNPGPVDVVTLYFHSRSGWYAESQDITRPGWNTLVFQKGRFGSEDRPAGWDKIDGIRLSPWRSTSENTVIYSDRLWAYSSPVAIVRAERSGEDVEEFCRPFIDWLTRFNVSFGEIAAKDVETGGLAGSRLAVFPYNGDLSDGEFDRVRTYVAGGGKVWAFYDIDERVSDLLGVDQVSWTGTDVSVLSFTTSRPGMPKRVLQASSNFVIAAPSQSSTKVLAKWEDAGGKVLDYPALLNGRRGSYMSHVLLADDPLRQQQMVLALLVHDVPDLARDVARGVLDVLGRVALYKSFDHAHAGIQKLAAGSLNPRDVEDALASAKRSWTDAKKAFDRKRFPAVLSPAFAAHEALVKAYALCQRPRPGEFRAVWNHTGTGVWPGDWPRSARELKAGGFGAVFPNMLDGGSAHYPSKLLPHSDEFRRLGDQIAQCLAACRAAGLEMHVWKVDWNLSSAPPSFIGRMRAAGRTQVDVEGNDIDWLCPSNPLNLALERDSLLEVVRGYAVDGIHLDYIRYPDDTTCYCAGCRRRFESDRGKKVVDWPKDCYSGPLKTEYRDWRCRQITRLVKEVHDRAKSIRPAVRISAAVFSDYPDCRESVGQDWLDWIRAGILDFVLPMDYTPDSSAFAETVRRQLRQVGGRLPVRPGIGVSSEGLPLDQVIVQVLETRKQKTGGFILFDYDRYLREMLPLLARGLTAPAASSRVRSGN